MAMPRDPYAVALSARLYRQCLRLYPATFRRAYGQEMARAFRDLCRATYQQAGARGVALLWLPMLSDLIVNALGERTVALRQRLGGGQMRADGHGGRLLWLGWIGAGAIGWGAAPLVNALLGSVLTGFVGIHAWATMSNSGIILVAAQGLALALAQGLVARRYVRRAGLWAWATASAAALAVGAMAVVVRGPLHQQWWTYDEIILLKGVLMGLAQWLVLRPYGPRAGWWIVVSALVWPLAVVAAVLVSMPLPRLVGPSVVGAWWFVVVVTLGWAIGGGLYGAVLGRVLVSLLRRSPRATAAL